MTYLDHAGDAELLLERFNNTIRDDPALAVAAAQVHATLAAAQMARATELRELVLNNIAYLQSTWHAFAHARYEEAQATEQIIEVDDAALREEFLDQIAEGYGTTELTYRQIQVEAEEMRTELRLLLGAKQ